MSNTSKAFTDLIAQDDVLDVSSNLSEDMTVFTKEDRYLGGSGRD